MEIPCHKLALLVAKTWGTRGPSDEYGAVGQAAWSLVESLQKKGGGTKIALPPGLNTVELPWSVVADALRGVSGICDKAGYPLDMLDEPGTEKILILDL